MSWYNPLSWKSKQTYQFSDNERRASAETRQAIATTKALEEQLKQQELRLESQARQLELKARIQEAQNILDENGDNDDYDSGDDSTSQMIGLLKMVIGKSQSPMQNGVSEPSSSMPSQSSIGHYTNEQIQEHLAQIPKPNMILLQKLDDKRIEQQIRNAFPTADNDSVSRALMLIKAQNLNS
jgi:hypothetical protein